MLVVNVLPPVGKYAAVILCVAGVSMLVIIPAVPPLNVTGEPTGLPSTLNCTVPGGVAVPLEGVTVALIVTGCPYEDGSGDEASAVVVPTAARPVPMSEMLCVAAAVLSALSVSTKEPVFAPATSGVKLTYRRQSAPDAKLPALELKLS